VGGNFCEKLEEAPRIKFRGFEFCGLWHIGSRMTYVNFELETHGANVGFDEKR